MSTLISTSRRRLQAWLLPVALLGAWAAGPALAQDRQDPVQQGQKLATQGDCVACHTAPGGKPFAGGLAIHSPLGTIYSSNITPSTTAGIGRYTLQQFSAAVREGVRGDGAHLYPAMPYTSYAKITDQDMAALYAYFMHGVQPVDEKPQPTKLPFPFNIRLSMAFWNAIYLDRKPLAPSSGMSAEAVRGQYLGIALEHCDTCHTPRDFMMGEKQGQALGGASLGTWYAPNISSDPVSGVGGWSVDELVSYLKTGQAPGKAQAAGPMQEAIDHSLRHLDDQDLRDIALWLKSTPPVRNPVDTKPAFAWGQPNDQLPTIRGQSLPDDKNAMSGPQLYDAYCSSCHRPGGEGSGDGLPSLFHNTTLGHDTPDNVVMAILNGVDRGGYSKNVLMPAFSDNLSDAQVTTLANFLLKSWGRPDVQVSQARVGELRAGGASSPLLPLARYGLAAGVIVVLLLLVWLGTRRRRR
ncbi:c-type cytochrome [Frateuria aurantia]